MLLYRNQIIRTAPHPFHIQMLLHCRCSRLYRSLPPQKHPLPGLSQSLHKLPDPLEERITHWHNPEACKELDPPHIQEPRGCP